MYRADNFYWASTRSIKARTESPSINLLPGVPLRTRYHRATSGFSNVLIPLLGQWPASPLVPIGERTELDVESLLEFAGVVPSQSMAGVLLTSVQDA